MTGPYREPAGGGVKSTELLKLEAASELRGVAPGSITELCAVLTLVARGAPLDVARARFSVMFVLDTSGSMRGEPLHQVCDSVTKLVDLLEPSDRAGVVAFSDNPSEVAPLAELTAAAKASLKRRVHALTSDGSTGISAGVSEGRRHLPPRQDGERQLLLVLTDGQPTDGTTAQTFAELARSFRPDVSVVGLGYGPSHNAELLRAFADGGAGQYWYIADPAQANVEFARAIGSQGDVVVDGVQLVLAPGEHVEVLEVLGEPRLRFGAGGVRVELPDLRDGEKRSVVVRLQVRAPRELGKLRLLELVAEHREAGQAKVRKVGCELSLDVTRQTEGLLDAAARTVVLLASAEKVRKEARALCDQQRFDAAAVLLRAKIAELEALPGYQKLDGSELSEAVEQLVDDAVMCERRPTATAYNEYRSSSFGVDVAQGATHQSDREARSALSKRTMSAVLDQDIAGEVLIELPGGVVRKLPLASELTIGRTPNNDLVLELGSVSKRHARIQCRFGKVAVVDLGSSNGIQVNGQQVRAAEVGPGDVVQIGDAKLRIVRTK